MDETQENNSFSSSKGQALVEFALVSIVLLLFIFIIIEAGRLFQSWLTVQNSARAAGRYALTGKYETDCLAAFPYCLDPRVDSIKDEARRTAAGLNIDPDAIAGAPGSFIAEVWSLDELDNWKPDFAGRAGDSVRVKITYRMPFVVPLFSAIVSSVDVVGQVTVTNEEFDQVTASLTYTSPPDLGSGDIPAGPPVADLKLEKSVHGGFTEVYAQKDLSWDISVQNLGPFDAEEVVIVDDLPPGSSYQGSSVSRSGYCDVPAGDTVTCYLPNLAGDGGEESIGYVTINTLAPKVAPSVASNTAAVSNGLATIDPNQGNNSNIITPTEVIVIPWADLTIYKSDNPDPVQASHPLTYTIGVQNIEVNVANNVIITDVLPAEVAYAGSSVNGLCTYESVDHRVICGPHILQAGDTPGDTLEFTIVVTAPSTIGYIYNTVNVTANEYDPDALNNKTTESTRVVQYAADLEILKLGPVSVNVGDIFQYQLLVHNKGDSNADEIVVTDVLPDHVVFDSSSGCGQQAPQVLTCTVPTLPVGGSITFTVQVTAVQYGQAVNTASVIGAVFDPVPLNNTSTVTTSIRQADLAIQKDGPTSASVGEVFDYTLTVANLGPSNATGVVVTDTVPAGLRIDEDSIDDDCEILGQLVVCQIGPINLGNPVSIDLTVQAIATGTMTNTVVVTGNEFDPDSVNNQASAETIVTKSDLRISKTAGPALREVPFAYTIVVTNGGPSLAADIVVTDTLPAEVDYLSNDRGCTYYKPPLHVVICDLPTMAIDDTESIEIIVLPKSDGEIINTAEVAGGGQDPDLSNNSISITTTVGATADLEISMSEPVGLVENVWFTVTLTVTNNGPSLADGIVVTNTVEIGQNLDGIRSNRPEECVVIENHTVICTLDDLLNKDTSTVIKIGIRKKFSGQYENTATTSSTAFDPQILNNTAFIDIVVN